MSMTVNLRYQYCNTAWILPNKNNDTSYPRSVSMDGRYYVEQGIIIIIIIV